MPNTNKKVEKKVIKVFVNKPIGADPKVSNAFYNLDGVDYLIPMELMTEDIAKANKVIKLTDHPEVVQMISRGTYTHSFYISDNKVEDEEAVQQAYANIA